MKHHVLYLAVRNRFQQPPFNPAPWHQHRSLFPPLRPSSSPVLPSLESFAPPHISKLPPSSPLTTLPPLSPPIPPRSSLPSSLPSSLAPSFPPTLLSPSSPLCLFLFLSRSSPLPHPLSPLRSPPAPQAHERTIHTDVLFSLMKKAATRRPTLKLIVTSATMEAEKYSEYFNRCPVFTVPGPRPHPRVWRLAFGV